MLGGTHLTNPVAARPTSLGQHPRWVIFVHGFGGHRGNFLPMRSYFHWRGQTATVSVGFRQNQSIESMAEELRGLLWRWIEEAPSAHLTFDLVGHSMGGILCRLVLEDPELAQHIRHIITLATPHRGTLLARFLDTAKTQQLRPDSALLQQLAAQEPWQNSPSVPSITCFWSPDDLIVMPADSALIEGATNECRPGTTHLGFLVQPSMWQEVYERLEAKPTRLRLLPP